MECPEEENLETESRLVVIRGRGRMLMGTGFLF